MERRVYQLLVAAVIAACLADVGAWPDGAPCIYAVIESMNPLEAVEHQGGLEMTPPPFFIHTEQKCYWRNQPVELTLRGNSTRDKFKGFAIQPFIYSGPNKGKRLGQFLRLDDNGSWQQQCFRRKDSVTHSHDEPKARMRLWWRNDVSEDDTVQFVATVVMSLRKFWVKSVVSAPLPPCRQQSEITGWPGPNAVSAPPPVSSFKLDTFHMFNKEQSAFLAHSFSSLPDRAKHIPPRPIPQPAFQPQPTFQPPPQPQPTFQPQPQLQPQQQPQATFQPQPSPSFAPVPSFTPAAVEPQSSAAVTAQPLPVTTTRRRLGHVIPIAEMETNRRPNRFQQQQQQQQIFMTIAPQTVNQFLNLETTTVLPTQQTVFQQQQQTPFRRFQQQQRQMQFQRQRIRQQQQQQSFQRQQFQQQQQQRPQPQVVPFTQDNTCRDLDTSQQCVGWLAFCPRSAYMRAFCRATCRFC